MDLRKKKSALMGLVGGLGVVAFLGSIFGELYSVKFGIFLALAIWIIGATLVHVLAD
jgi:hypothetical protein